jgi:hypothetical protein
MAEGLDLSCRLVAWSFFRVHLGRGQATAFRNAAKRKIQVVLKVLFEEWLVYRN